MRKVVYEVYMSLLQTKNLQLIRGERDLLSNIGNLKISEDRNLLILGPSGCGKTSLLHVLAGLLPPTGGDVFFLEQNYSQMTAGSLDKLRGQNFGFVFQGIHLLRHLNVVQNIALAFSGAGRKAEHDKIQSLIARLGLKGKECQKAHDLSHGEAQRVAIARACAHSPKIIFADEPTSALDDRNTKSVMELIQKLSSESGAALIVTTHDQRIKPLFNDVLEMRG